MYLVGKHALCVCKLAWNVKTIQNEQGEFRRGVESFTVYEKVCRTGEQCF